MTRLQQHAKQQDAAKIFHAQIAAERLLRRSEATTDAVMSLSRDEVHELARNLEDVAAIATRHHLLGAGSLSPESFPEPTL